MPDVLAMVPSSGAEGSSGGSMVVSLLMFGGIILIFYFLILRPQRKKQKETDKMLAGLAKNDKIVSIGGIRGVVQAVKESTVIVKVDDNTKLEFNKSAVSSVLERKEEKEKPEKIKDASQDKGSDK